jgi:hypothetical protein
MEAEKNIETPKTIQTAGNDAPKGERMTDNGASEELSRLQKKPKKTWLVFLIIGVVALLGGAGCLLYTFLRPQEEIATLTFPKIPSPSVSNDIYSNLTGLPIDASLKNAPAYCIQVPNGTDGARPQSSLTDAGVVFEAIAEAGITRFAAIFQNPTPAVIGPIRSLRLYYLEWDTPFDCTIVHAGGAGDALRAVAAGGYSDLTENYTYMYRGTYGTRLWNNLFTTPANLARFSQDSGKTTSDIQGFARMTPEESKKSRVDNLVTEKLNITTPTTKNTSKLETQVSEVNLRFGGSPTFNVSYTYNAENNTYTRNYGIGPHEVYTCPNEDLGERNPEDVCSLTTMAPSVVVAMVVSEHRASDNYHEDITTLGSGDAYIFQNGMAIRGTWNKPTRADQIKFLDADGNEIKLAPGQTFVSAIPQYGGIDY